MRREDSDEHGTNCRRDQVCLLGAQCQRRTCHLDHRAAHRLGLRVQQETRKDSGAERLRIRAESGPLRGKLRRGISTRIDQLQPGVVVGDRTAEGHRRRPSRAVAARRAGKTRRNRRPSVERSVCRECRQRLVQGRVHPSRRAMARTRRTLPAQRGIPARAAQDMDRGRCRFPWRFLPHPRFHVAAEAVGHCRPPEPRAVPGRKFRGGAAQCRTALGLVFQQRQGLRRRHRAITRRPSGRQGETGAR